MTTSRRQVVIDHILESTENAATALDVHEAFPTAQRYIVHSVLEQVEQRLKEEAYGRELFVAQNGFVGSDSPWPRYIAFLVHPTRWPTGVHVGLTAEATMGRQISAGLYTEDEDYAIPNNALDALIMLRADFDKPYPNWPWWYWLEPPYANWMDRDALPHFLPGPGKPNQQTRAVEDLFAMLHEIIEVADPHLRQS